MADEVVRASGAGSMGPVGALVGGEYARAEVGALSGVGGGRGRRTVRKSVSASIFDGCEIASAYRVSCGEDAEGVNSLRFFDYPRIGASGAIKCELFVVQIRVLGNF